MTSCVPEYIKLLNNTVSNFSYYFYSIKNFKQDLLYEKNQQVYIIR